MTAVDERPMAPTADSPTADLAPFEAEFAAPAARPNFDGVVAAHVAAGFDRELIVKYVKYWNRIVAEGRAFGHTPQHVTGSDFTLYHDVLNLTMPDDTAPVPDSPHHLLELYLLDPGRGETGLRHTNRSKPARDEDCYAMVKVI